MTTDPLVVTHTIALGAPTPAAVAAVVAALAATPGVHDAHAASGGLRVKVCYDLRHLRLDDVAAAIRAAGATPAGGLLAGLWRRWASFTENNMLASVRAEVRPCCNLPPDEK